MVVRRTHLTNPVKEVGCHNLQSRFVISGNIGELGHNSACGMNHSLLAVSCLCITFSGVCNTHITVRHLFAVYGSQTRFWTLAQVWRCVKSVCSGWLWKMHVLVDFTFSSVFVYLMLCGLFYFCSWTKRLPHSAVMLWFLFVEQITFFCCYSENVENRSIVISAFLRDWL